MAGAAHFGYSADNAWFASSLSEYHRRIMTADLALDSTVANGESTSLDLMWLGPVPWVTDLDYYDWVD